MIRLEREHKQTIYKRELFFFLVCLVTIGSTQGITIGIVRSLWWNILLICMTIGSAEPVLNTCLDNILQISWKDKKNSFELCIFEKQTIVFDVMICIMSSSIVSKKFSSSRSSDSHRRINPFVLLQKTVCEVSLYYRRILSVYRAHSSIIIYVNKTLEGNDMTAYSNPCIFLCTLVHSWLWIEEWKAITIACISCTHQRIENLFIDQYFGRSCQWYRIKGGLTTITLKYFRNNAQPFSLSLSNP